MAKVKQPERISEMEFLRYPESLSKIELIDGGVVASPAPSRYHQEILRRIVFELGAWAKDRDVAVFASPNDVRLGPDRILQPDAFVVLERVPFKEKGPLTRIPDLCIEVLSHDVAYDRMTKRLLYAEAGVREYWVVSPSGWLERWTGPGLVAAETVTGVLRSPLLPGFEVDVASLFPAW